MHTFLGSRGLSHHCLLYVYMSRLMRSSRVGQDSGARRCAGRTHSPHQRRVLRVQNACGRQAEGARTGSCEVLPGGKQRKRRTCFTSATSAGIGGQRTIFQHDDAGPPQRLRFVHLPHSAARSEAGAINNNNLDNFVGVEFNFPVTDPPRTPHGPPRDQKTCLAQS